MADLQLKELGSDDFARIAEVDRTELVEAEYVAVQSDDGRGLRLERSEIDPPQHTGPWTEKGVEHRIDLWKPEVEAGGLFVGAFRDLTLVGFAVPGPVQSDRSRELCALFVDFHHRHHSVGSHLLSWVERVARERGARSLWVGSNRTASAVEFYLQHGCKVISLNSNAIVKHHSGDPVFAKEL